MTAIRIAISALVLTAVLLAGCETEPAAKFDTKTGTRIVSLKVVDPKIDYATLIFEVELDNPYSTALSLLHLRYSLNSGASTFLTAAPPLENVTIPPKTTKVISLPDKVFYDRLLRGLDAEPGTTIPYDVGIWLHAETPDHRKIGISARHKGLLALPETAKVTIEGKEYHTVDVVFVATPADVVTKMLEVAHVTKDDILCDLGCGDGRIPIAAAMKYGCRTFGYDIDPAKVREAIQGARTNNVSHLVTIQQKDIYTVDLSPISVVAIYLLPTMNEKLIPQFAQLKSGSRIVAHNFAIPGIKPDATVHLTSREDKTEHSIFLYTTPLKKLPATGTTQ